jgi:hypothetical protein
MDDDPHIHVPADVGVEIAVRNMMTKPVRSGAGESGIVRTGCGLDVPYLSTSHRPERVTCRTCRQHAVSATLRLADQAQQMARAIAVDLARIRRVEGQYRELAEQFRHP